MCRAVTGLGRIVAVFGIIGAMWTAQPVSVLAQGAGDLLVAPTRVVFEGRTRSAQLALVNSGSATATYRIVVINLRMDEKGELKKVTEPLSGEKFANKFFRYSPRRIVLKPGASQAIRLVVRKRPNMAEGEYRSHLLFTAVPPSSAGESIEKAPEGERGISIRLVPIYGISIPVIIRHGKTNADVTLSDLELLPAGGDRKLPKARFRIDRTGNASSFGDITATFKPDGGPEHVVGQVSRLAVYVPGSSRIVEMPLRVPDGVNLARGKLHVAYRVPSRKRGALYAETEVTLP